LCFICPLYEGTLDIFYAFIQVIEIRLTRIWLTRPGFGVLFPFISHKYYLPSSARDTLASLDAAPRAKGEREDRHNALSTIYQSTTYTLE
jgi:hypothetical protein